MDTDSINTVCMILCGDANAVILVPANFRKFKEKMALKTSAPEDKEVSYSSFGSFSSIFQLTCSISSAVRKVHGGIVLQNQGLLIPFFFPYICILFKMH